MIQLGKKAIITAASTLVLFGAVIAGVAIASGEDFDPVHAPDWKAGYSFSYDVTGDIQSVTEGTVADKLSVPGQANLSFGPFPVKKEILSTQYDDPDGGAVYVSAATFPFSNLQSGVPIFNAVSGQKAFVTAERQSDLAPIPVLPDLSCTSDDCVGGGLDFLAGNDMTYLNFPLSPDKRWEQTINLPLTFLPEQLRGIDRMHVVGEVTGLESVDLGDFGKTDAVRVDFAYTPVGLQDFVAEYAQAMEDAGLELERFTLQVGLHEIVWYSEEMEAVVQQEYILYGFIDIAAKGEVYGHQIDDSLYAEMTARVQLKLTGANTDVAGKERTPTEILEIVGNPSLIADSRGQGIGATPYTITLEPSHDRVNAADSPMVNFALAVHGLDRLPEGTTTAFEVTDAVGNVIPTMGDARGTHQNNALVMTVDEPGVYYATATVTGPDGVKTARARLIADWEEEVQADCWIDLLGTSCMPHEFPVLAGVDDMDIWVRTQGATPALLGDYMVVQYADGDADQFDGNDVASYDDAAAHGLGAWNVDYRSQGDYFARATYVIHATYSAPEAVSIEAVHASEPEPEGDGGSGGAGLIGGMLSMLGTALDEL